MLFNSIQIISMKKYLFSVVAILFCVSHSIGQQKQTFLTVPGFKEYAKIDTNSYSILPSGRYVQPVGKSMRITHDPFGLKISPDGAVAITLHENVFTLIDLQTQVAKRIPDYLKASESPLKKGSFLGIAFHPTKKIVYLSGGDEGTVVVYDYAQFKKIDSIKLDGVFNGTNFTGSFTSDLVYHEASNNLLILDRGNFRLVRYSLANNKIVASIPTGRQPFGLAISPDQKTVLVANVGMYDYPLVGGTTKENIKTQYIGWHPYGNNTKESIEGTIIDGKTIPGLGDPNAKESMSVYCIDLNSNKVKAKLKTGLLLGELVEDAEVIGGASPNSIAIGNKYAYVTNATNDNIAVIDYKKVECGILAKNFLKNKIGDKIPSCITKDKDRYQRVVAECFIGNESLSRFMVREGYAVAYSQYSKDFVEDEKFAKENRLGIWAMSFQMPSDYRKASRNK